MGATADAGALMSGKGVERGSIPEKWRRGESPCNGANPSSP
jgi:hypothetical protein